MRPRELIVSHTATDFDALAAMMAARLLYPRAVICLPGALNRNVREFVNLHADELDAGELARIDLADVARLIVVETSHASRLGRAAELLGRSGVEVVLFDHHQDGGPPEWVTPGCHVVSTDRALSTTMVGILGERGIEPSATEATALALGIHEDTGSLTHPTAGVRDAEALAWCMRRGASQPLIASLLHTPLSEQQRGLLGALLESAEPVDVGAGQVLLAAAAWPHYVDAASTLASRMADLTEAGALVMAVEMGDRVVCVGRSRVPWFDVAAVLRTVGGGGHPQAASAHIRGETLESLTARLRAALPAGVCEFRQVADVMSAPAWFVDASATIEQAMAECRRRQTSGVQVSDSGMLVGIAGREHLDRAIGHGLGHAPVRAVLGGPVDAVAADASLSELQRALVRSPAGRVPVVAAVTGGPYPVEAVLGIATRTDLLAALRPPAAGEDEPAADLSAELATVPGAAELWPAVQVAATGFDGVYLVGGAVRDLLLGSTSPDVDLAVEGDGIAFARALAERLGGRMHAHEAFHTAVVLAGERRIDVASARSEHYEQPASLPVVEHASIQHDLNRRDFTVNAMAVSVRGADFGRLLDPHRGRDDLRARALRVLHPLSFVEDPTRIFRAVRYESRYGFAMEPATLQLARSCIDMGLVGDLSGARVRDELVAILEEPAAGRSLERMDELRLAAAVHAGLDCGPAVRQRAALAEQLRARHAPAVPAWRPALALICHALAGDDLAGWLDALRLRRVHARAVGLAVVAIPRLAALIAAAESPSQVSELLAAQPADVAIVLAATDERVRPAVERHLAETAAVELELDGDDLHRELGLAESPLVGRVLAELLRRKRDGLLPSRDDELRCAAQLIAASATEAPTGLR
jgi:tRNA nucleotidyltransferase (CCA-adding enzyme)